MSDEMITVRKSDLTFVRAYNTALEGMKTLLTRERDEARANVVDLEKRLASTHEYILQREKDNESASRLVERENIRLSARVAELEKDAEAKQAVLRTFGPALAKQAAVEALGRVRERIEYELDSDRALAIIDAELTILEAPKPAKPPSITIPTKPTRPLAAQGLLQTLDLVLPDTTWCHKCNEPASRHCLNVGIGWCNHNEIIAEFFPDAP